MSLDIYKHAIINLPFYRTALMSENSEYKTFSNPADFQTWKREIAIPLLDTIHQKLISSANPYVGRIAPDIKRLIERLQAFPCPYTYSDFYSFIDDLNNIVIRIPEFTVSVSKEVKLILKEASIHALLIDTMANVAGHPIIADAGLRKRFWVSQAVSLIGEAMRYNQREMLQYFANGYIGSLSHYASLPSALNNTTTLSLLKDLLNEILLRLDTFSGAGKRARRREEEHSDSETEQIIESMRGLANPCPAKCGRSAKPESSPHYYKQESSSSSSSSSEMDEDRRYRRQR